MSERGRPRLRPWMLLVGIGGLIAIHVVLLLYCGLSHTALSAPVLSSVVVLMVIKHLGWLGPLYALFRRRPGREKWSIRQAGRRTER